jgi:hypothetical protein
MNAQKIGQSQRPIALKTRRIANLAQVPTSRWWERRDRNTNRNWQRQAVIIDPPPWYDPYVRRPVTTARIASTGTGCPDCLIRKQVLGSFLALLLTRIPLEWNRIYEADSPHVIAFRCRQKLSSVRRGRLVRIVEMLVTANKAMESR